MRFNAKIYRHICDISDRVSTGCKKEGSAKHYRIILEVQDGDAVRTAVSSLSRLAVSQRYTMPSRKHLRSSLRTHTHTNTHIVEVDQISWFVPSPRCLDKLIQEDSSCTQGNRRRCKKEKHGKESVFLTVYVVFHKVNPFLCLSLARLFTARQETSSFGVLFLFYMCIRRK